MKKGQLVKIKEGACREALQGQVWYGSTFTDVYVIVRGPYEGLLSETLGYRLTKVVDLLTPTGNIIEKIECIYLSKVS